MSSLPSDTLPANHRNATNVLLNTLAELETIFAPLFATPSSLSETLAKLDIEKRCQLELMIGYAINTLAFINLKTNGTAPNTHPVMHELKRIKQYTEKLRHVTQGNKPNMEVDKQAAERFIKGALAANLTAERNAEEETAQEEEKEEGSSSAPTPSSTSHTRKRGMDPFQGAETSKSSSKSSESRKKKSKSDK
ncbi:hypothetical protein BG006_006553 [Podila minutissima]|uniref:Exosome complex protein n=1 Tax=Podila minutissima TaxID=64525 RepID=A0A9P5SJ48_9FUNG|nr:hypothetical protein BG006_006553 [Podila minutissima]